ncbi:MAG: Polyribonucleotide nucleotidyltransferase [bacterium]|nr:Polyribonucleotide nucleotidyltransferase [bacterium]
MNENVEFVTPPADIAPPEQNEMAALLDAAQDYSTGDVIEARVVAVEDDRILLDTGTKAEGILPREELSFAKSPSTREFAAGDILQVMCIKKTEDTYVFSKRRVDEKKVWERAKDAHEKGKRLTAKVIHPVKGGLIVDINGPAFLPQSHADIRRLTDEQMAELVGQEVLVKVLEIDPQKNRLVVTRRKVMEEDLNSTKVEAFNAVERGAVLKGRIEKVVDFGAFINLGTVSGLMPLSEIAHERVEDPAQYLKVGEEIEVQVIRIDPDRRRITVSRRALLSDPWDAVKNTYKEGDVVTGTIIRLKEFGIFVKLPDGYFEGMAHISELVDQRINHPKDVFKEGDQVDVVIMGVDPKKKRIKLSVRRAAEKKYKDEIRELEKEWKSDKPLSTKLDFSSLLLEGAAAAEAPAAPPEPVAAAPAPEPVAAAPEPAPAPEPVAEAPAADMSSPSIAQEIAAMEPEAPAEEAAS